MCTNTQTLEHANECTSWSLNCSFVYLFLGMYAFILYVFSIPLLCKYVKSVARVLCNVYTLLSIKYIEPLIAFVCVFLQIHSHKWCIICNTKHYIYM